MQRRRSFVAVVRITSKTIKVFVSRITHYFYTFLCLQQFSAGHSNLANHARNRHTEEVKVKLGEALLGPTRGALGDWITVKKIVSPEAKNMFAWIEWIVMADLPVTVVENDLYKKRSNLSPTTYKTVTKHMEALLRLIKSGIKRGLPPTFGIIFDGWSCDGEHYVGIFATWVRDDGSVVKRLIACGVQDLPETNDAAASFGFTADDIGDYIFDALASYGHDFSSVEFLTGDNAYVNGALCTKIEGWIYLNKGIRRSVPLVGCASHKLNLAVQSLCSENPIWSAAILRVHTLMVSLKSLKNRVKLAVVTSLNPQLRNDTRWRSTYLMLKKYLKLVQETDNFQKCSFDCTTCNLIPLYDVEDKDSEFSTIKNIVRCLKRFDELCVWLQTDNPSEVKMSTVRFYFDKLLIDYPTLQRYLGKDSYLVHCPNFDNAISKIQLAADQGKSTVSLSDDERAAVAMYATGAGSGVEVVAQSDSDDDGEPSFIEQGKSEYDSKRPKKQPPYYSTLHISPTSNIVERLFSRCGLIMRPHRRLMDPSTLEMLVMLRFNRDLWDERDVDTVIARN